ncbi:MAG TPA: hypothetical protein PLQ52_09340, partial [Lacunisphaera sp.]|nr:hypothetical protein [Lacunisphaera sp.]
MNKVYIILPLICTLIFTGFYIRFDRHDKERQAGIKAREEAALKAKVAKDVADRATAIAAAVEASKKREVERKLKNEIEDAKKTARQEADDRRLRTYEERNRARDQVVRLKKDQEEVKST